MKIQLNQEVQDEFGYPIVRGNRPPMTLRDIIVNSILAPVRDEEERPKQEKWEIFKKIRSVKTMEVELKAEEVALIKKLIAKFQSQLIMGECHEMIEGKYERLELIEGYEPVKNEINADLQPE